MKIRTSLTLKTTVATAAVFLLCMVLIYVVSSHSRSRTFYHDLKGEAVTKAHLFLQNQVDAATMQSIYLNNRKFIDEVEVAVYTSDFRMLYHDAIDNDIIKENADMIARILSEKEIEFDIGEYQGVGLIYTYDGKDYIVTAAAYDGYGHQNMHELLKTLVILFVIGLSLLYVTGYILAGAALRPVKAIAEEAEKITESKLDHRLPVKNDKDELGELSMVFNSLLERLEQSFKAQKNFVSNVSHEMKTPLASLTAELDLALQKDRTAEQYRAALQNALQDAHNMTRLTEGLLNLARADYQREQIRMQDIRLDELLLDVREYILRAHADYHVDMVFDQEETDDDRFVSVSGNLYLLNIAFTNLIDNNCKYSDNHTSIVHISYWDRNVVISMSDTGIGLSDKDKQHIFTLFYRGEDSDRFKGNGIGMTLADKIIRLHNGSIEVHSHRGQGTTFVVRLPHL